jgi:methyl coenzyme M reductase subunit C
MDSFTLLPDRQCQLDTYIKQLTFLVAQLKEIICIADSPARRFNRLPFCSIHHSVLTSQFASSPP